MEEEEGASLKMAESNPNTLITIADAADNQHDLQQQLRALLAEKTQMQIEFNAQRAKLKELFLQKEDKYQEEMLALQRELDELKSQFVVADMKSENEMRLKELKAQEEISSLQQIVQDTIDESTFCKAEFDRLQEENKHFRTEIKELRDVISQQQQESTSLGPQVLNQVKKTIARKLAGDSLASHAPSSQQNESSDDVAKRGSSKFAKEDPEVLCSIVTQLQEEMKALKEKLREADEKLQMKNGLVQEEQLISISDDASKESAMHKSTSTELKNCDTCQKYGQEIQTLQTKLDDLQTNLKDAEEDLNKEATLRKDLENQWQVKRDEHKLEVQNLSTQVKRNEKKLLELQQKFLETREELGKQFERLSADRIEVDRHLRNVQADNDFLSGKYLSTAEEIESQYIDLPNTVQELQELILRQRNDLIQARVSSEYEKQKCVSSLDEIKLLRDQLEKINEERNLLKRKLNQENKSLQDRVTEHLLTLQKLETEKKALERKESELNRQISELRVEIIELQETNEKLLKANSDYKSKLKNLQDDLATSEQVQKDFVKLSQNLQIALEKLRSAEKEVRWQDDDDVDRCPTCSVSFTVTVRKLHCRHCGNIYCDKCLCKSVPSGPRKRMAKVCDICHTLLTPNTAPYFSLEPLNTS